MNNVNVDYNLVLNLYNNTADSERVDKTQYITNVGTLTGVLREQTSITNIQIVIEYNSIPTFNYVHIPLFNRYYFVDDIVSVYNNLWEITLSVDVLMSYKNAIKNLYAFVDRNEFINNSNIIDEKRVIEQGYDVEDIELNNAVFDSNYFGCYLITGLGFEAANIE